ncbi:activator of mitotic machinery Cdc14 phosphatase activation C-term-domain-containing protein, partial [Umbelopsis sp. PMI_123]
VPAEQHPEIAPAEFANWLQSHGVIRAKGQLRVRRKRSILAISYVPGEEENDDDDDDGTRERPSQRSQTYREPGRRFGNRRSQSIHAKPSDYPERFGVVPPGGITLQDRPVSISEIIDFGGPDYEPAESQQGIITRVHDAENEVFSRIAAEENQQQEEKATQSDTTENAISSHIQNQNAISNEVDVVNDDFSRFPVHIERAIYRLSHYKLSNPRRPLHHQVLISNLMFWYLSIINGQKIRQQALPHQSGN